MARRVFFSFHYERDVVRASQVRNHYVTKDGIEEAGYIDAASWEAVRRTGDDETRKWIQAQLNGTSVTVVLIGAETSTRYWVDYEMIESLKRNNGLFGIYIHNIKDFYNMTDRMGPNPMSSLKNYDKPIGHYFHTYDWVYGDGYHNFPAWVELAAQEAGNWRSA